MTSMGQHTRILNYHYYKYIIFNFSNLITFYWAKKVDDESKWLLGMGPVFKEHRTHAVSGQDERPVYKRNHGAGAPLYGTHNKLFANIED